MDISYYSRRILSNLRCSSHCLNVEIGRHQHIDCCFRFCNNCLDRNCYVVEDEFHFVLVCTVYNELRLLYFQEVWTNAYPTTRLFYDIMSEYRPTYVNTLIKYLIEAFKTRKLLLNEQVSN